MSKPQNPMTEFDNVNTVNDLIKQNKKLNPTQEILKQIYELDPADGLLIVQDILTNLSNFHASGVDTYTEQSRCKDAAVWAYDKAMIDSAQELLSSIEL